MSWGRKPGFWSLANLKLVVNVGKRRTETNGIARFPCDSTAFLFYITDYYAFKFYNNQQGLFIYLSEQLTKPQIFWRLPVSIAVPSRSMQNQNVQGLKFLLVSWRMSCSQLQDDGSSSNCSNNIIVHNRALASGDTGDETISVCKSAEYTRFQYWFKKILEHSSQSRLPYWGGAIAHPWGWRSRLSRSTLQYSTAIASIGTFGSSIVRKRERGRIMP